MNSQWQQYQDIINAVVKPALGCTEPVSAAYAAAVAAEMLNGKVDSLSVQVSDNLFKNSMGVFVPGTGKIGLAIAAAVGALAGDANADLAVLEKINKDQVAEAQALIDSGNVAVSRTIVDEFIYCYVEARSGDNIATVKVSGGHTKVVEKTLNGEITFQADESTEAVSTASICEGVDISVEGIYDYALNADFDDIKFILESAELNSRLSEEGLKNEYGLQVGRTIEQSIAKGLMAADLGNTMTMASAAASDARMGGASLPAMSNYGSGNQGIAATMPLVIAAKHHNSGDEKLARSLIMSHLGAIYIKSHYPPLSPYCGNTVTSAAASMGLVYLAGGSFAQSCSAIQNVLSDCSGMVCDGAKSTCAMKVKTSTRSAFMSSLLAMNSIEAHDQGIVAHEVEQSIRNVGQLVTLGMSSTDTAIINIMAS
ncbi:L-cysteine desulfidase [Sinobacterium caligoides]|uniref:UPF0597 protein EDC56_0206 n=1 Tax=Sinobacterium caligoides TaxID=933926 RepID=A0A3N2DXY3_9GAMM|nr:L-serine ammonia-lyase, iron-sulfur-dependent, subunit alpha [Sinobacterium caligoides]ROS04693.1 L-cysteine desulfidase [Sinobacterium caligoides]